MKQTNFLKQLVTNLNLKAVFAFALLFSVFSSAQAQEVLLASAGNTSGGGGSASYSVGQIIQNTSTGAGGSAIQGIQFYFEDSVLAIVDLETNLNIATYPNPSSSFLNIKIQGEQNNSMSYQLFNLLGQVIISGKITNNAAKLNIEHLEMATYLLKVTNRNNSTIKTFKIIKN